MSFVDTLRSKHALRLHNHLNSVGGQLIRPQERMENLKQLSICVEHSEITGYEYPESMNLFHVKEILVYICLYRFS